MATTDSKELMYRVYNGRINHLSIQLPLHQLINAAEKGDLQTLGPWDGADGKSYYVHPYKDLKVCDEYERFKLNMIRSRYGDYFGDKDIQIHNHRVYWVVRCQDRSVLETVGSLLMFFPVESVEHKELRMLNPRTKEYESEAKRVIATHWNLKLASEVILVLNTRDLITFMNITNK